MVLGGVAATLVAICVVAANDDFDAAGVVAAVYLVTAIALRLLMTSREREQIGVALERRRGRRGRDRGARARKRLVIEPAIQGDRPEREQTPASTQSTGTNQRLDLTWISSLERLNGFCRPD